MLPVETSSRGRGADGDADFDAHRRGSVRRGDAEAKPRAVDDTRRQRDANRVMEQRLPLPAAAIAPLTPGPPPAAARRTHAPHRHLQRHRQAVARRETSKTCNWVASTSADGRSPRNALSHALDDVADRGKVDGDLVRKAGLRRRLPGDGVPGGAQRLSDDTVRDA